MLFASSANRSTNIEDRRQEKPYYQRPQFERDMGEAKTTFSNANRLLNDIIWSALGNKPVKLQGGPKNKMTGVNWDYKPPVGAISLPRVPTFLPTGGVVMTEFATQDENGDLVWDYGPNAEYMPVTTRDEVLAYRMRRIQVAKNSSGK